MPISAREGALRALYRYRKGAWTEDALDSVLSRDSLDGRDASLCARLFYGVVQNLSLLDFYVFSFSNVKSAKLEPQVLDILRLSVYQLVFLSKIPVNAAVSEGVTLTKKHANPRAAGLVNAVLRAVTRNLASLPEPGGDDLMKTLSVRYSHPEWLVRELSERLPADRLEELLRLNNAEAPITAVVNTLKTTTEDALRRLLADGVEADRHPWLKDGLVLKNARGLTRISAFREGLFYIQDAAAVLALEAAAPEPGMLVLDGCAAPGGKSFAAAIRMNNKGKILSCDLREQKLRLIEEGAARLGLTSIETRAMDAAVRDDSLEGTADVVLADVPCSGFGVIRKKPEIRYKKEEEIAGLPALQEKILLNLSGYVKPGGVLLYSTCTLLQRENEDIVSGFLKENSGFFAEPFELPFKGVGAESGMTTLWPQETGTDGFFICRLRRRA